MLLLPLHVLKKLKILSQPLCQYPWVRNHKDSSYAYSNLRIEIAAALENAIPAIHNKSMDKVLKI